MKTTLLSVTFVLLSGTLLAEDGWQSLFDGKALAGWEVKGGKATYKAENGMIVGTTTEGSPNTFLCKGPYSDFELELDVLCDKALNSGIQIRSHVYEKDTPQPSNPKRIRKAGEVYGYQCEIAPAESGSSGNFWDEGRHTKWLDDFANKPEAKKAFKDGEWNHYRIVALGDHIRSWVNDVPCADFRDKTDRSGFIGLQVHGIKAGSGPYQVRWKNIRLREFPPRDIAYTKSKNALQTLDVYAPPDGKDHPVAVWIHGGGWHRGDKAEVEKKPQAFVDRGFVFVSINYRLFPDANLNEMTGDVAEALRWTHDHAQEYGGDPRAMFVLGHSAGAQLAALVSIDDRYLKAAGLPLSAVRGCVPVDGDSYDVPLQIKTVEEGQPLAFHTLHFGDPQRQKSLPTFEMRAKGKRAASYLSKFGDEPAQKELSAVTHVARGKNIPPFLILHVADHAETKAQSERLAKALNDAGVSAKTHPAKGKNHGTINADLGVADDEPTKAVFAFLSGVLKK